MKILIKLISDNLLTLCHYIISKVTKESRNNIWVLKLINVVKEKLRIPKDSVYINLIKENNYNLYDILKQILKCYPETETINQIIEFFKNFNKIETNEINQFFRENIIRVAVKLLFNIIRTKTPQ